MNIVHLSDTHLGVAGTFESLQRIVGLILIFSPTDTVVVHTGDLIENYSEANCEMAEAALGRLHRAGFTVLLCPGNHDYSSNYGAASTRNVRPFRDRFACYLFQDGRREFPTYTVVGNCAFIGLDSAERRPGVVTRLLAEGSIGQQQRDKLITCIGTAKKNGLRVVVYLHHHPFIGSYSVHPDVGDAFLVRKMVQWFSKPLRRLEDAHSFVQILRDKVDVLLFGHQHLGLNHTNDAMRYGVTLALDGSSSTGVDTNLADMHIRVIDTETLSFETVCVPLRVRSWVTGLKVSP